MDDVVPTQRGWDLLGDARPRCLALPHPSPRRRRLGVAKLVGAPIVGRNCDLCNPPSHASDSFLLSTNGMAYALGDPMRADSLLGELVGKIVTLPVAGSEQLPTPNPTNADISSSSVGRDP